jgi:hypothetical protein
VSYATFLNWTFDNIAEWKTGWQPEWAPPEMEGGWRFRRLEEAQCIGERFEALKAEAKSLNENFDGESVRMAAEAAQKEQAAAERRRAAETEQLKAERRAQRQAASAAQAEEEAARLATGEEVQRAKEEEEEWRAAAARGGGGGGDGGDSDGGRGGSEGRNGSVGEGETRDSPPDGWRDMARINPNHPWVGGPPYVNVMTGESRDTRPVGWQMNPNHPWVGGPPYVNTETGESRGALSLDAYSRLPLARSPSTTNALPLFSQVRHQMGGGI